MITVIVDTREQQPWGFANAEDIETVLNKLDTGDYTIAGLEDILCIERKKSVAELAKNVTEKRFESELERMSKFPHKFLLLEFDYHHIEIFPKGSKIPRYLHKRLKVKSKFIMKSLSDIQIKYGVHVIPCGNVHYAELVASSIIKRINEQYK